MSKSRFSRKYNISLRKGSNDDAEFIKVSDHVMEKNYSMFDN